MKSLIIGVISNAHRFIRAGHSANNSANFVNTAFVAKQCGDLPAIVANSLDEWVERTRGTSLHIGKPGSTNLKNITPRSQAQQQWKEIFRWFGVLRSQRALLTAENFERFVLLRKNEIYLPQSFFFRK